MATVARAARQCAEAVALRRGKTPSHDSQTQERRERDIPSLEAWTRAMQTVRWTPQGEFASKGARLHQRQRETKLFEIAKPYPRSDPGDACTETKETVRNFQKEINTMSRGVWRDHEKMLRHVCHQSENLSPLGRRIRACQGSGDA